MALEPAERALLATLVRKVLDERPTPRVDVRGHLLPADLTDADVCYLREHGPYRVEYGRVVDRVGARLDARESEIAAKVLNSARGPDASGAGDESSTPFGWSPEESKAILLGAPYSWSTELSSFVDARGTSLISAERSAFVKVANATPCLSRGPYYFADHNLFTRAAEPIGHVERFEVLRLVNGVR